NGLPDFFFGRGQMTNILGEQVQLHACAATPFGPRSLCPARHGTVIGLDRLRGHHSLINVWREDFRNLQMVERLLQALGPFQRLCDMLSNSLDFMPIHNDEAKDDGRNSSVKHSGFPMAASAGRGRVKRGSLAGKSWKLKC